MSFRNFYNDFIDALGRKSLYYDHDKTSLYKHSSSPIILVISVIIIATFLIYTWPLAPIITYSLVEFFKSNFKYLAIDLKLIKPIVFNPTALLVFLQLGITLTIFALSNLYSVLRDTENIEKDILESDGITLFQRRMLTSRRRFIRFLSSITLCGILYFIATPIALYLVTFPEPKTGETPAPIYIISTNFVFLLIVVPTFYIAIRYIQYRARMFRD